MLALQIIFALTVTVGYVYMGGPPPPQPSLPPPPQPSIPTGCQPDMQCEEAYKVAVIGIDPCQAARTFKTCAEAAQSLCSEPISSLVEAFTAGARDAVAEKCNEVSENLPSCASICTPYEEKAIGDFADQKKDDGCAQYLLYRTCLQNFVYSPDANCNVGNIFAKTILFQNTECPRNCTEYYNECSQNLPRLAADGSKLGETCLLWSWCKGYDFSPCQKTLTVNYDSDCKNETTISNGNGNGNGDGDGNGNGNGDGNGTPVITGNIVMVVGVIGAFLLLMK